jgi:hypothetical protein
LIDEKTEGRKSCDTVPLKAPPRRDLIVLMDLENGFDKRKDGLDKKNSMQNSIIKWQ